MLDQGAAGIAPPQQCSPAGGIPCNLGWSMAACPVLTTACSMRRSSCLAHSAALAATGAAAILRGARVPSWRRVGAAGGREAPACRHGPPPRHHTATMPHLRVALGDRETVSTGLAPVQEESLALDAIALAGILRVGGLPFVDRALIGHTHAMPRNPTVLCTVGAGIGGKGRPCWLRPWRFARPCNHYPPTTLAFLDTYTTGPQALASSPQAATTPP